MSAQQRSAFVFRSQGPWAKGQVITYGVYALYILWPVAALPLTIYIYTYTHHHNSWFVPKAGQVGNFQTAEAKESCVSGGHAMCIQ